MGTHVEDRRKHRRYSVDSGLLFSDNDYLIGLAQVVDISRSGVRCVSLSQINCTICMLENIELFGTGEDMLLTGLSGRMTRCSDNLESDTSELKINCYEFGFEFSSKNHQHLKRFKKFLSAEGILLKNSGDRGSVG